MEGYNTIYVFKTIALAAIWRIDFGARDKAGSPIKSPISEFKQQRMMVCRNLGEGRKKCMGLSYTRWGKSRCTAVHMENNTIINK